MKKVFALLSVLALTFVMFGLATQPTVVEAADPAPGKWIVDPTLAPGEVPMYVAGSAATTFPNHFDEAAAKGTPQEDKGHRIGDVYPWNETKVLVPRYDAEGNLVGTYGVYPLGSNVKTGSIAGQMIWQWVSDDNGGAKVDKTFGWVSLSQIRHNFSGVDVTFMTSSTRTNETPGNGSTAAHIVFDGAGKAVRGLIGTTYFAAPDPEKPEALRFTPEFGYKDGKVVKIIDGDTSGLDRLLVQTDEDDLTKPLLDDLGNPVLDDLGNPMYEKKWVLSEDPNLFYKRFVWNYLPTAPEDLNTVGYMEAGWRADFWDYYDEETKLAYLFLEGDDGKFGQVNQEQADIHNATLGLVEGDAGFHKTTTARKHFLYITVPNNGIFYDFGYLERIADGGREYNKFFEMFSQAYDFGRTEEYKAVRRAYNFSAKPIELSQGIFENKGYMPLNGTNVYEVLPGTTLKPSWLVNIAGMLGGYTDLNDITSYKNLPESELEIEVDVNGKRAVYDFFADIRYDNRLEMVTDFVKDLYTYLTVDRPVDALPAVGSGVVLTSFSDFAHGVGLTEGFKGTWVLAMQAADANVMWEQKTAAPFLGRPTAADNPNYFMTHEKYYDKWMPLFDVFDQAIKLHGATEAGLWGVGAYTPARRINLYVQNITLKNGALDLVPEGWIFSPHAYKYETWSEMLTAFLTDFHAYLVTKEYIDGTAIPVTDFIHGAGLTEGFGGIWPTKFGTTATDVTYGKYPLWGHYETAVAVKGSDSFLGKYFDKWVWLFEHFDAVCVKSGLSASFWKKSAWTPTVRFAAYLKAPDTYFTADQIEQIIDAELLVKPIYVKDSGYVQTFPPAYRDLVINTGTELNRRFVIDIRINNKATGLSSSKQFVLVVTDCYTPLLEVDNNKLFVTFGQSTLDLKTIAKAYDRNYSKLNKNIKGWEISQNITFDYEPTFDPANLAQGKHEIKISITSGSKTVSKRVLVSVPDTVAPVVDTRDLYLPYGADFNPVNGIVFANDNVEGNLFNSAYRWYTVIDGDDINTTQPGEYQVEIQVIDRAGNPKLARYTVYVMEKESIDSEEMLNDIQDIIDEAMADATAPSVGCASKTAAYFVSVIAVLGVALLVFRKRQ